MEFAKVNVDVRSAAKKGAARRVRSGGAVPGVLYGRKREPLAVTFNEKELLTLARQGEAPQHRAHADASRGGRQGREEVTAMVRDAQINPLRRRLVHVDFLRVDLNAEVHVTVPLVLTGKAIGVTNGGNLHQSMHMVPVAAKPAAIPTKLEVDVSALDIGDALHVSDLKLGAGVRVAPRREGSASRRSSRRRPRRSKRPRRRRSRARSRPRARRLRGARAARRRQRAAAAARPRRRAKKEDKKK